MPYTADQIAAMSNSALDDAYAQAYTAKDYATYLPLGYAIVDRRTGASGMLDGLLTDLTGTASAFPQYDAIQAAMGNQTLPDIATNSAVQSAQNAASTAALAAKTVGGYALGGLSLIAIIAIAAVIIKEGK